MLLSFRSFQRKSNISMRPSCQSRRCSCKPPCSTKTLNLTLMKPKNVRNQRWEFILCACIFLSSTYRLMFSPKFYLQLNLLSHVLDQRHGTMDANNTDNSGCHYISLWNKLQVKKIPTTVNKYLGWLFCHYNPKTFSLLSYDKKKLQ